MKWKEEVSAGIHRVTNTSQRHIMVKAKGVEFQLDASSKDNLRHYNNSKITNRVCFTVNLASHPLSVLKENLLTIHDEFFSLQSFIMKNKWFLLPPCCGVPFYKMICHY